MVDTEDKANDEVCMHDLTLDVNNIIIQSQIQTLETSKPDQRVRLHNHETIITYKNLHLKNNDQTLIERIVQFHRLRKIEVMNINVKQMQKANIFVPFLVTITTHNKELIFDHLNTLIVIEVEVHYATDIQLKTLHHKNNFALILDTCTIMNDILLLYETRDPDMTNTEEILAHTVHLIDPFLDHPIDVTPVRGIDHVHFQ